MTAYRVVIGVNGVCVLEEHTSNCYADTKMSQSTALYDAYEHFTRKCVNNV
jgi:hypothetical protein